MAAIVFGARPPQEAVAYFRSRTPDSRLSFDWRDVWQDEHLTAFVVAKMMQRDLLADVHNALTQALLAGTSRDAFIKGLRPLLEAKGWWGLKDELDPLTGETRTVRLGSPRRLGIIYDVNMRMAHASAAWSRIQDTKEALPYLVYTAVLDDRTRDQHARWGGRGAVRIILPVDHPFWLTHYPPNGWRCRCSVLQMSQAMLERRGWAVTTEAALEALDWKRTTPWLNRRTGRMETVPAFIDPGFGYNVGAARRGFLTPPPTPEPQKPGVLGERWPRALPPTPVPRRPPFGAIRRTELEGGAVFDAFARTLGVAEGGVFIDAAQMPLVIERGLFETKDAMGRWLGSKADKAGRAQWAELLAAAVRDPDEIWISAEATQNGGVRLSRRYVAAFRDPGGEQYWFTAVFSDRDGWWMGTTAYPPGKPNKPDNQAAAAARAFRVGTLVYQRGDGRRTR